MQPNVYVATLLMEASEGAKALAENHFSLGMCKRIDVRWHIIRELVG